MLAFSMSDGSTHFRYRDSMDIVTADENYDEVKSLPQSGFIFPTVEPSSNSSRSFCAYTLAHYALGLYIAFSPNACVLAFLKPDGTPKIESMKYGLGSLIDILPNDRSYLPTSCLVSPLTTRSKTRVCCCRSCIGAYLLMLSIPKQR